MTLPQNIPALLSLLPTNWYALAGYFLSTIIAVFLYFMLLISAITFLFHPMIIQEFFNKKNNKLTILIVFLVSIALSFSIWNFDFYKGNEFIAAIEISFIISMILIWICQEIGGVIHNNANIFYNSLISVIIISTFIAPTRNILYSGAQGIYLSISLFSIAINLFLIKINMKIGKFLGIKLIKFALAKKQDIK